MGLCNCQEVPLTSSRNPEGSESSLPHQHCGFLGCLSFQGESHIAHTPLFPSENIIAGVWSVRSEFLRALVIRFSGGSCPWPFPGQEVRGWWHSGGIQAALGCLCQVGQELSLPQPLVCPHWDSPGDKPCRLCCSWNTWEPQLLLLPGPW